MILRDPIISATHVCMYRTGCGGADNTLTFKRHEYLSEWLSKLEVNLHEPIDVFLQVPE